MHGGIDPDHERTLLVRMGCGLLRIFGLARAGGWGLGGHMGSM